MLDFFAIAVGIVVTADVPTRPDGRTVNADVVDIHDDKAKIMEHIVVNDFIIIIAKLWNSFDESELKYKIGS